MGLRSRAGSVVATLLFPISAIAQSSDLSARIDRIFAGFGPSSPGCAVGLAKDGKPLYTHGYGSANLEYGVPLTDSTVLESGSVAKQFTASAIMALVADGKIALSDDIKKYLPEVPDFGGQKIFSRTRAGFVINGGYSASKGAGRERRFIR